MKFFRELFENEKTVGSDTLDGIRVKYELKSGDIRRGTSRDGKKWERKMTAHYGFIPNTVAVDNDSIDVYVNPKFKEGRMVYVIHQMTTDGSRWDEDKVMIGFADAKSAKECWASHIHKPKEMFGGISEFTPQALMIIAHMTKKGKTILASEEQKEQMANDGLLPRGIKSPLETAKTIKLDESIQRLKRLAGL